MFFIMVAGTPFFPQKGGKVYKRGPKPPFLWEKGAPANFKMQKILTEFSFGIGMVNTKKIPKGSYRNTESVCNSNNSAFIVPIITAVRQTKVTVGRNEPIT
jgi:hypothetical protein